MKQQSVHSLPKKENVSVSGCLDERSGSRTICGITNTASVFLRPKASAMQLKKTVPITAPRYSNDPIQETSIPPNGGTSNGLSLVLKASAFEVNQASVIPKAMLIKFAGKSKSFSVGLE